MSLSVGQFMLFRRAAYEAVGGHEAVRDNPVDDVALGRLVVRRGLRWMLANASEHVVCRMYTGLGQAVEGFSKNLFAFFGFRVLEYLFIWGWTFLLVWEPLVVLGLRAVGIVPPGFSAGLAGAAASECFLLWVVTVWRFRLPKSLVFAYPLGVLVFLAIAVRSMLVTTRGYGSWKGRRLKRSPLRWL